MNNVGRESDKSRTQGALRADNLSNAVILDGTVAADVENNLYGSIDAQKSEGGGGNDKIKADQVPPAPLPGDPATPAAAAGDWIIAGAGRDNILAGAGNDLIETGSGGNWFFQGSANGGQAPTSNPGATPDPGGDIAQGGAGDDEIWGYSRAEIADAIKGGDKLAYGLAGNAPEVLAANPANDPGGARNSGHNHGNNDHNRDFRKRHRARKRNQSQSAWHGAPTAACTNGFGNITNTRSLHRGAPHA